MIDERINRTLAELEVNLQRVKSAQQQVSNTVSAYEALQTSTKEYLKTLSTVNDKFKDLADLVGSDYNKKVKEFERDRSSIMESCQTAIDTVNSSAEEIKETVSSNIESMQKKLTYTLIANVLIIVVMIALFFLGKM